MKPRNVPAALLRAVALATCLASGVGAQADDGTPSNEGALFLLLPVGAQGVSMGRAVTAVPSVESAFWNPAGLGGLDESRFLVFRGDQLAGEATAASVLISRQPIGVVGFSYMLLDAGEIDLTDEEGNVRGAIDLRSHLGVASFAASVFRWLDVGANLKFVQENFSCRGQCDDSGVRSTGWAVDFGLQAHSFGPIPLRLGAMVAHLGPDFQVVNASQADPLPSRIRVGAGLEILSRFLETSELRLWLNFEIEDRWRDLGEGRSYYFGTEFEAGTSDVIYVRSGYVDGEVGQADGFAVGVGLRYERFELGLAKNLAGSITGESEPVHVSFGLVL
jgi:hypothetical protein